jgi:hypothetical protein
LFLRRLHSRGDTQRALIIFDESRYAHSLRGCSVSLRTRRRRGCCNWPIWWPTPDTRLLDEIISSDAEDGVIHGLVHLARSSNVYVSRLPYAEAAQDLVTTPYAPLDRAGRRCGTGYLGRWRGTISPVRRTRYPDDLVWTDPAHSDLTVHRHQGCESISARAD